MELERRLSLQHIATFATSCPFAPSLPGEWLAFKALQERLLHLG